jgi:twinkle protein
LASGATTCSALERNQQDDDEMRTTTTFRVLKDRYTGRATGSVFYLRYDQETGMLNPVQLKGDAVKASFENDTPQSSLPDGF